MQNNHSKEALNLASSDFTAKATYSAYLYDKQQTKPYQWPTLVVIATIYLGWFATLLSYSVLPIALWLPLMILLTGWQSSLQHEFVHGHPFRRDIINTALGICSFNLVFPYQLYKSQHLLHHRDTLLTSPIEDPESKFILPQQLPNNLWQQQLLLFSHTVVGAMLFTPFLNIRWVWQNRSKINGTDWALHLLASGLLLYIIIGLAGVSFWFYFLAVSIPSQLLINLRSFIEHGAALEHQQRSAVVGSNWFWQLLYLNNNFHIIHHQRPGLPWYAIKPLWDNYKHAWLKLNGHFYYKGYWDIIRRYAFTPATPVIHPLGQWLSPMHIFSTQKSKLKHRQNRQHRHRDLGDLQL